LVSALDRLEGMEPASAGVVQSEGHAVDSKAVARWTGRIESVANRSESPMEVLRWLLFFAIAMFVMVAGIFLLMGRDLPIPSF